MTSNVQIDTGSLEEALNAHVMRSVGKRLGARIEEEPDANINLSVGPLDYTGRLSLVVSTADGDIAAIVIDAHPTFSETDSNLRVMLKATEQGNFVAIEVTSTLPEIGPDTILRQLDS